MKFQIDPRVAHLTAAQLAALTDRYHAGERAIDLVTEYQGRCAPNQLYRLLPPKILREGLRLSNYPVFRVGAEICR